MVILYQDNGIAGPCFADHGVGESLIDGLVVFPIGRAEYRSGVGNVAQRPQSLIGQAVVVALLLLFCQPDAPDAV